MDLLTIFGILVDLLGILVDLLVILVDPGGSPLVLMRMRVEGEIGSRHYLHCTVTDGGGPEGLRALKA